MPWEQTGAAWETRAIVPAPADGSARTGAATRLLILGCVRIFEPVHGYFLHRELVEWAVDRWANVHPGSIYNALRSLARAGLLEEVSVASSGARPKRTAFSLTEVGDREYLGLLRSSLVTSIDPVLFAVAVNFATDLPRAEVVALLRERVDRLRANIAESDETVTAMLVSATAPPSTTEVARLLAARLAGELGWVEEYAERVGAGAYSFAGEAPDWVPSPEQIAEAREAGAGMTRRDLPRTALDIE
jgi:DNA-binding PadR family transcriptional regulator